MKLAFACVCVGLLTLTGCPSGLVEVMRENGYTPLTPPSSAWELGSAVEVGGSNASHPFTLVVPSKAGVDPSSYAIDREAPDVSASSDVKYGLDVGVAVPDALKVQLQFSGARKYSLVTTGNKLHDLNYAEYLKIFETLRKQLKDEIWDPLIQQKRAGYLSSLWTSQTLEYQFYNESGVKLTIDASKLQVPADLKGEWALTTSGTLSYKKTDAAGNPIPVCLGFVSRPIRRTGPTVAPGAFPGSERFPGRVPRENEITPLLGGSPEESDAVRAKK